MGGKGRIDVAVTTANRLAVRAELPAPFQDVLDFAYHSGWRKHEIRDLTWDEVDLEGKVIRLTPHRSKTREGRVLPLSPAAGQGVGPTSGEAPAGLFARLSL